MKFNYFIWLTVFVSIVSCAGSAARLRKITELAPPVSPVWSEKAGQVLLSWEKSPSESSPDFAGYNIYIAEYSLIFTSPKDLPLPVTLELQQKYLFSQSEQINKTTFVHIRSRDVDGGVSLPSLPEIIIPAKSDSLAEWFLLH